MITIQGLSQNYHNQTVLRDIHLTIDEHERCALVGRNGSGKTTLIHTLLGFIPFKKGQVLLNGIPVHRQEWKAYVSYLPEKFSLYPHLTGGENISFFAGIEGKKVDEEKVKACLKKVGLWGDKDKQVKGYSKGMLQRLGLGIMLYFDTPIMILDEPTSGLDPHGRAQFLSILKDLQDKTILFSSHHMDEIKQICTHVALLEDGVITKFTLEEFNREQHKRGWLT
ncbi:ABC-type multidrug transport system ATPase subunit [Caldalkalibacillus uzonensis]|uniref:ABC-type multidrug transport system ATPase subunit n=1 Tax=Caldalkalibacillus uzonensis TaxID=353224 RepID=A0ABU0CSJ5_9BACI|nr:ABC transporter ATP-binding protein [Caldalkalibacillus uzonensis]MDQ0339078.1 ABC-type multidrug transport system ATPase subunit [Caldalkalibacillus uzonensis]